MKKKLDPKFTPDFFIGYPDRSKWYKFYVVTPELLSLLLSNFLKNDIDDSENFVLKELFVEPNQVVVSVLVIKEKVVS